MPGPTQQQGYVQPQGYGQPQVQNNYYGSPQQQVGGIDFFFSDYDYPEYDYPRNYRGGHNHRRYYKKPKHYRGHGNKHYRGHGGGGNNHGGGKGGGGNRGGGGKGGKR